MSLIIIPIYGFIFIVFPFLLVLALTRCLRADPQADLTRARLTALLYFTGLGMGGLGLALYLNQYSGGLSSSLPGLALLPVLAALLVFLASQWRAVVNLWQTDRQALILSGVVFIGMSILVGLQDATALAFIFGFTLAALLTNWITTRWSLTALTGLCLVGLALMLVGGGGSVYLPSPTQPQWLNVVLQGGAGLMIWISIFLIAAQLSVLLRPDAAMNTRQKAWRISLIVILLAGMFYQLYWDGIWSAAHDRAFEDHLPFAHLLLGMVGGLLLYIHLPGWRKAAGVIYPLALVLLISLGLAWGWNVSAFEITERRAAQVDAAVQRYFQDTGHYPASLGELTPSYLLYLPPPVVVRQGGWCYQGGQEAYRLGYISGKFTYFSADFKIEDFAQSGEVFTIDPACTDLIADFEAKKVGY